MSKPPVFIKINPNASKERENYLPNKEDELVKLICERVKEVDETNKTADQVYDSYKRHDSILIDARRGVGKSTLIDMIKNNGKLKEEKICILDVIDPNQLDKRTSILDIIVNSVFNRVKQQHNDKLKEKNILFNEVCELKSKIEKLIFITETRDYDNVSTKSKTTNEEMELDRIIHHFADKARQYLDKNAIVIPIDDIDMALNVGSKIIETLRKYLKSPWIIPVIALDSGQIYALIKKQYFEKFGYKAKTPLHKISSESEMGFLKKLPSEFIQKILPPSQRIALPDMLMHYTNHLMAQKTSTENIQSPSDQSDQYEIIFIYTMDDGTIFRLPFDELLKLIMSILFDYNGENITDPKDYHVINYLKNKSFRSFMDDAEALMKGLKSCKSEGSYSIDREPLKIRFRLYSKGYANNEYDAAIWFWENYIDTVYAKIQEHEKKNDFIERAEKMHLKLVEDILSISPSNSNDLLRKEKSYFRLYMQDFFLREITVTFEKTASIYRNIQLDKSVKIIKTIDIRGYLEMIIRTIFPAKLFETLYNEHLISLEKFPLERLKEFSHSNFNNSLSTLYDQWVPFWLRDYTVDEKKQILGIVLEESKTNPYRKNLLNFASRDNIKQNEQEYYIHPFKEFSFISEFKGVMTDRLLFEYMPASYLHQNNHKNGGLKQFKEDISSYYDQTTELKFTNSNLGIISAIHHTENAADNIIGNLLQINDNKDKFDRELEKLNLNDHLRDLLYLVESQKNIATTQAIFINSLLINILENHDFPYKDQNKNDVNHKFSIHKGYTYSGSRIKNSLLPFVVDDPYLHNIGLLSELDIDDNIVKFFQRSYNLSGLRLVYLLKKPTLSAFKIDSRFDYSKNVTEQIIKLVKDKNELKLAYLELFYTLLTLENSKTFTSLYTKYTSLKNRIEHIKKFSRIKLELYDKVKQKKPTSTFKLEQFSLETPYLKIDKPYIQSMLDFFYTLLQLKYVYEENKDYVKKNTTILLLDAFVYYPNFIPLFGKYIQERQKAENAS